MRNTSLILLLFLSTLTFSQTKVDIPDGVVYNYCKNKTYEKAKELVLKELNGVPQYELLDKTLFVGPILWNRIGNIDTLSKIERGRLMLLVDSDTLYGKMTQNMDDAKLVWDQIQKKSVCNKALLAALGEPGARSQEEYEARYEMSSNHIVTLPPPKIGKHD